MSAWRALSGKTRCHWRNTWRVLQQQSRLKVWFIALFALVFELTLLILFLRGFIFLNTLGGAGTLIINRLFSLFFLGVGIMIVISSMIITYSTFFRSPEVPFLLSHPVPLYDIITLKFLETTVLCSWAFFFIMIPFLAAYAYHQGLSPLFGLWNLLFSIPYLGMASGIGILISLAFVRWFPRRLLRTALILVLVGACLAVAWSIRTVRPLQDDTTLQFNLAALLPGLALATNRWMPGWWVSEGILAMSKMEWGRGMMFLAAVITNGMLVLLLVQELGRVWFEPAWHEVQSSASGGNTRAVLFPRLSRILAILRPDVRGLVLKDIRMFIRDPMQWSQALIFFGILAFYFSNLRSFRYHLLPDTWRNTIAFLNVFSVSAVMCSLGARFVYPQLSLEGQAFWTVGLSPLTLKRVLLTKFWTASLALVPVSIGLMLLSSSMLSANPLTTLLACSLAGCLAFAISGLSTGIGAVYIDLEQRNPAAIVSGFGGTLNLVVSLFLLLAVILPVGAILHWHNLGWISGWRFQIGLAITILWLFATTGAATIIPLVLGVRRLRALDF
ncbi:MAG: hypothetical protein A2269_02780 [Lentisphaerae bacterium RIFOXYA12_FULL_60_10]|nr:MAG: hypothetical protein A2269_02780 [Lentisphaerae bacterium RIFOXYA12_FULL_60_10]